MPSSKMDYKNFINTDIIEKLLNICDQTENKNKNTSIDIFDDAYDFTPDIKKKEKIEAYFKTLKLKELRSVYAFFVYGRRFSDCSITPDFSFKDMENYVANDSSKKIKQKFQSVACDSLKYFFSLAKKNFEKHESNVEEQKIIIKKRLSSYKKKVPDTYIDMGERKESNNQIFKKSCNTLINKSTKDIKKAKGIIEQVINETGGSVVVDFLGGSNYDNLDYVECDEEIIKLYWKYSKGPYDSFPHNLRVDIAFEELQEFEYGDNISIILKGYSRSKKEINNYYNNKEKLKRIYAFRKSSYSYFHYQLDFDKKQRGSIENFNVDFLPWRYFNIIILPRENLPSAYMTTKLLIWKNITDMHQRGIDTYNEFRLAKLLSEDEITMYGNRFRKIVEALLKFVLLVSDIMFKDDYEKDMLGKILEQLKDNLPDVFLYDEKILIIIIDLVENSLLNNLNICSHDNVKYKIKAEIIDTIFSDFEKLINLCYLYFKLKKA